MPEAVTTQQDAIERVLSMLRDKLDSAFRNGQRVRMEARDHAATPLIPSRISDNLSLSEMLSTARSDGGFEIHIYIEPKR